MYAIIKTGGKQYRVEKGTVIYVEKLPAEAGDTVVFEDVLVVGEEGKVQVGAPYVKDASVTADVVKNGKGKKINILTYRPKKGSVRRKGHRQPYTMLEIAEIFGSKPVKKAEAPKKEADKKETEKKETTKTTAAKKADKK